MGLVVFLGVVAVIFTMLAVGLLFDAIEKDSNDTFIGFLIMLAFTFGFGYGAYRNCQNYLSENSINKHIGVNTIETDCRRVFDSSIKSIYKCKSLWVLDNFKDTSHVYRLIRANDSTLIESY